MQIVDHSRTVACPVGRGAGIDVVHSVTDSVVEQDCDLAGRRGDCLAVAQSNLYVADSLSQTGLLGELHHAIASGSVADSGSSPELGEIIAGKTRGRVSESEITIADLTGTGIQDTAIATFAFARAKITGAARTLESLA